MQGINWFVFTQEEKTNLQAFIDRGDKENMVCAIESINMDLEKEEQIQKIIDQMTPDDEDFVSLVEDEVSSDFIEGTPETEKTPEMEAEYQAKLDKERAAFVKKAKAKKSKKEALSTDESADEEIIKE
jgi:hypothetical protein